MPRTSSNTGSSASYLPLYTGDSTTANTETSSTSDNLSRTAIASLATEHPSRHAHSSAKMLRQAATGRPTPLTWVLLLTNIGLFLIFIITSTLPHYAESVHSLDHTLLEQKVSAERAANSTLFWGTYRPNLYFGTRPRLPQSVMTGLMWFKMDDYSGFRHIRHTCEHGDNFERYGYLKHDGRFFGMQELVDGGVSYTLKTEFVKRPGGDHGK
ncbi:mannosyl oligosaccharide glucosidase-domain-containing protein [Syncephalis plumigaleata]|nr:mannosyl oligosaccharide glucosidase-domain-containing protein [Syncephalis plumigaleata]